MKLDLSLDVVRQYAAALERAGASRVSSALVAFAAGANAASGRTAAEFHKKLKSSLKSAVPAVGVALLRLEAVERPLIDFVQLLERASAKKALVTDLKLLLDLARSFGDTPVSVFESSVVSAFQTKENFGAVKMDQHSLVDAYLERLEAALGDEVAFGAVYNELCADKRISQCDAVAIASKFLSPIAASTSRPKALRHTLRRHEKLLEQRAAAALIGGRAA